MKALPVLGIGLAATVAVVTVTVVSTQSTGTPMLSSATTGARRTLVALPTGTPDASAPPYARTAFGVAWQDTDRNGCDQRNDVLRRDLHNVVLAGSCVVQSGLLTDPYTGLSVYFTRAPGYQPVQIDHVRSLRSAWYAGAWEWSPAERLAYATDLRNLLPTTLNSTKGDSDPAELAKAAATPGNKWKPSAAGVCTFSVDYVLASARYNLPVAPDDARTLADTLKACP